MKNFRVAAVQFNGTNNKDKNYSTILNLTKNIRKKTLDLLLLPEVFNFIGPEKEERAAAEHYTSHSGIKFLKDLAIKLSCYIAGGSVLVRSTSSSKLKNRCVLIDPKGRIVSKYDKIHLFDVSFKNNRSYKESDYLDHGENVVVVNTPFAKIGFAICYDLRFPELFRKLRQKGAEVIVLPAAFITKTGPAHWETLLRARAIENQCYIVAANQIGPHGTGKRSFGGSIIIDPWGNILKKAKTYTGKGQRKITGELIMAQFDSTFLKEVRSNIPSFKNARLI